MQIYELEKLRLEGELDQHRKKQEYQFALDQQNYKHLLDLSMID